MNSPKGKRIRVVAAVLRDPQGRILLCRRAQGQSNAGFWEFPGGKSEPAETQEQALIREIREELALEILPGNLVGESIAISGGKTIHLAAHWAEVVSGEPILNVHDQLAWVEPQKLAKYKLTPADISIAIILANPLSK
ncbi:MAG TPA: (deoxy)nucleoside triphosphate pyrophosphohydrolase [Fibrobacteraceae bacterium]|nr:(deoxy)nucleoside triphosphate pyrophosphohydrolase [Fibrobacteraceae bacterium]